MITATQYMLEGQYKLRFMPLLNSEKKIIPITYLHIDLNNLRFSRQREVGYVPVWVQADQQEFLKEMLGIQVELEGKIRVKTDKNGNPNFGLFTVCNFLVIKELYLEKKKLQSQIAILLQRK